ncbi:MAG: lysylphosphatidylglycerol synthase domain-containing protein [Acidilobaceae archaeon]
MIEAEMIEALREIAGRVNVYYALASIALYFLSLFIWSFRWALASRIRLSVYNVAQLLEGILVGILVNNLVGFYSVGGEVARVVWVSYRGSAESARLLAGVAVERVSEVPIALAYLAFFTSLVRGELALLLHIPAVASKAGSYARLTLRSLREALSNPLLLAALAVLSTMLWLIDSLRLLLLARSVGVPIDIATAASLTLLGIASRIVLLTPANLGIFEGVYLGFLKASGYSLGDSLAVVLAERLLISLMPSILGALIVLREGGFEVLKRVSRDGGRLA